MRFTFKRVRIVQLLAVCSAIALTGCVDDGAYYRSDDRGPPRFGTHNPEFGPGQRPGYDRGPNRREDWRDGRGRTPNDQYPVRRYPPNIDRDGQYYERDRRAPPSVYDRQPERDYRRW